jgi:hypothetical protein
VRVARYRFSGYEVVAVLSGRLDVRASFGRDGVTVFEDAERGRVVRHDVELHLPRRAHVTNARTGEALGETDRLRATLTAGDGLVLTLGPAREAVSLSGPTAARRGTAVELEATFAAPAQATPASPRLLRWHVIGPGGELRPEYARVTVEDGPVARFVVPSALNDPAGEYRVRVADVLSGAWAEALLRLE